MEPNAVIETDEAMRCEGNERAQVLDWLSAGVTRIQSLSVGARPGSNSRIDGPTNPIRTRPPEPSGKGKCPRLGPPLPESAPQRARRSAVFLSIPAQG